MALVQLSLSRLETSDALGTGERTVSATITSVWDGVAGSPTTTVQMSALANITEDELSDYQAFIAGIDELVTDNEATVVHDPNA